MSTYLLYYIYICYTCISRAGLMLSMIIFCFFLQLGRSQELDINNTEFILWTFLEHGFTGDLGQDGRHAWTECGENIALSCFIAALFKHILLGPLEVLEALNCPSRWLFLMLLKDLHVRNDDFFVFATGRWKQYAGKDQGKGKEAISLDTTSVGGKNSETKP